MNGFNKILHLCQKTGILQVGTAENALKTIQYGPLGSLLRKNIFTEWLDSIVRNHEFAAYPVEFQNPRRKCPLLSPKGAGAPPESLLIDVVDRYFKILPMTECALPFGIATYGPCINENKRAVEQNLDNPAALFRDLESWGSLSSAFFCPSEKSLNWFHYWSRHRYRWWRKFSNVPSKFSLSDVTEFPGGQRLSLMLEYPWGKERIETISLHDDNSFRDLCSKYGFEGNVSDSGAPAVVTCETELDSAVFAYLTSAFSEKWRQNEMRNVLQLHVKLAPYKVCVCLSASSTDTLKKLSDVANHLMKDFRKANIMVFPRCDVLEAKESHFQLLLYCKYDEMGVPYSVALNDNSLVTGVAGLRNRDTTLQEEVHITELTQKLQRYLQVMAASSQAF